MTHREWEAWMSGRTLLLWAHPESAGELQDPPEEPPPDPVQEAQEAVGRTL